jgi:hypothetical protein
MEQGVAELPLAAEVISAPDPIAAAAAVIEQLKARRVSLLDRIQVNERSAAARALDAFTGNGKALKEVADWDEEAVRLARERSHLDAALAEAERRHQAAIAAEAAKEERDRARQALERFNEFGKLAQEFSDTIDQMVQLYGELREAAAALRQTGYGPVEAQITRWGQRLIVYRCQHDRNLRFEDMMADGRERVWLERAPRDWWSKLQADTAAVLGPTAEAAE